MSVVGGVLRNGAVEVRLLRASLVLVPAIELIRHAIDGFGFGNRLLQFGFAVAAFDALGIIGQYRPFGFSGILHYIVDRIDVFFIQYEHMIVMEGFSS